MDYVMSAIGSSLVSSSLPLPESAGGSHPTSRQHDPTMAAKVAQDFESVFASMLLKEMRQSLEPGSLFGEDSGDVYGGLFDQYLGEHMTQGTGLGMSRMLQESIERMQRAALQKATPASEAAKPITG
jgi:Rod binding domain-containing protein